LTGSIWILSHQWVAGNEPRWQLVALLSGAVFLLSWLPLRLFLPVYVALAIQMSFLNFPKFLKVGLIISASVVAFPTARFVVGVHGESLLDVSYPVSLLEATGGVFLISPHLVIFAVVAIVGASVNKTETSELPNKVKATLAYG